MSTVQIIVGSMLGNTEYVAEACEEQLQRLNHQTNLHLTPQFEDIISATFADKINNKPYWLICTSTHGAGEYPDNIQAFVNDLKNCGQDLSTIQFLIIGMGDSNYDTFCQAAKNLNNLLILKGCQQLAYLKTFNMHEDIDPEDLAQQWLLANNDLL